MKNEGEVSFPFDNRENSILCLFTLTIFPFGYSFIVTLPFFNYLRGHFCLSLDSLQRLNIQ